MRPSMVRRGVVGRVAVVIMRMHAALMMRVDIAEILMVDILEIIRRLGIV